MYRKVIYVMCIAFVFLFLNGTSVWAGEGEISSIEQAYSFPVTSDDLEWRNMETTEEMLAAYQIPESILKRMTTKALVETILSDTFLTQFEAYDDSIDAIRMHEENFNIYRELKLRADYYETLVDLYQDAQVITKTSYYQRKVEPRDFFYIKNLEILIAAEKYWNSETNNVSLAQSLLDAKVTSQCKKISEKRDLQDIYSMESNGFYWFSTNISKANNTKGMADLLGDVVTLGETSTTTRTPNGTIVQVALIDELTSAEISAYDSDYASKYPAATKLYHATNRFNCHSYAWYSQNTATNNYWIRSPKAYWEDGSYTKTGIALNCKVRYLSGTHSAVVSYYSNGVTYYTSKWGSHGLYYHAPNYGPAFGVMQGVEYYTR